MSKKKYTIKIQKKVAAYTHTRIHACTHARMHPCTHALLGKGKVAIGKARYLLNIVFNTWWFKSTLFR